MIFWNVHVNSFQLSLHHTKWGAGWGENGKKKKKQPFHNQNFKIFVLVNSKEKTHEVLLSKAKESAFSRSSMFSKLGK